MRRFLPRISAKTSHTELLRWPKTIGQRSLAQAQRCPKRESPRPLRDDQQPLIVALDASPAPTADRQTAWRNLQSILAGSHENVRRSGVADHELDRAM